MKPDLGLQVVLPQDVALESPADVNIWGAHDQVVDAQRGGHQFVRFSMVFQFYVCSVLLVEVHAFACEFCICLLVIPIHIV